MSRANRGSWAGAATPRKSAFQVWPAASLRKASSQRASPLRFVFACATKNFGQPRCSGTKNFWSVKTSGLYEGFPRGELACLARTPALSIAPSGPASIAVMARTSYALVALLFCAAKSASTFDASAGRIDGISARSPCTVTHPASGTVSAVAAAPRPNLRRIMARRLLRRPPGENRYAVESAPPYRAPHLTGA